MVMHNLFSMALGTYKVLPIGNRSIIVHDSGLSKLAICNSKFAGTYMYSNHILYLHVNGIRRLKIPIILLLFLNHYSTRNFTSKVPIRFPTAIHFLVPSST